MIRTIPDVGADDTVTHTRPPTAVIRLIHRHNRAKFGRIFGTDRAALKKFWQSLLSSDDGKEFQALHPDLKDKTPEDLETSVPIIIHEDAAPYSKRKGVNVLQWGPLMVNGSDIESRFVYYNHIAKNKARPAATARRAWDEFWDDAGYMANGVDRFGAPIAQDDDGTKWCFIFTFAENDYDMDVEHGLPNCKRAILFCKHCRATNIIKRGMVKPHPHIDNGPRATWRDSMVTSNTDVLHRIVRRHPLTDIKGFNRFTPRSDLMHCMDHHGVYGTIFASVAMFLIYNNGKPSLGATQDARLATINHRLANFYEEHKGISSRLEQLTLNTLLPGGAASYADLRAPHGQSRKHTASDAILEGPRQQAPH